MDISSSSSPKYYRRVRLVMDADVVLPAESDSEQGAERADSRDLDVLLSQPDAVLQSIMLRAVLTRLAYLPADDLSRLAGCVGSDEEVQDLLAKILAGAEAKDPASVLDRADAVAHYLRSTLRIKVTKAADLPPANVIPPNVPLSLQSHRPRRAHN